MDQEKELEKLKLDLLTLRRKVEGRAEDERRVKWAAEQRRSTRRAIIGWLVYALVGIWTWAHIELTYKPQGEIHVPVAFAGLVWPIYWAGEGALTLHQKLFPEPTKPPPNG